MASNVETLTRSAITKGIGKVADFNRQRLPRPTDAHPYLTGIHTPMDEELTLESLAVDGAIPAALSGRYLRNGPNPALPPDPASYHWFTGAGMVHGLRIEGGKALWRSEEHKSELQSLMRISYAVLCLKKTKNQQPDK